MNRFSVVVVLYKKEFEDSVALRTLLTKLDEIQSLGYLARVYVWNNSPGYSQRIEHESVVWCEGDNVPLPKIYNQIARITLLSGGDLLMISDDDTDYSEYSVRNALQVIEGEKKQNSDVSCFVPKVYCRGNLVSPARRRFFKGRRVKYFASGLCSSTNVIGINSGIIITSECAGRLQPLYNENLRFYGSDTDFFVRYEKEFRSIYVLDSAVNHSLSESSAENIERALFRWRDHAHSLRVTFGTGLVSRFIVAVYIGYLGVKLMLLERDIRFLYL